ncbi:MAG: hemerythrin domain-containing protein [Nitrospirales bacterium]
MGQTEFIDASFPYGDMTRMVKDNHMRIMTLFQEYIHSPPDSRQALQEQILRKLASHLDRERDLLFQQVRSLNPHGQRVVSEAEVESEGIKAMILELQHSEGDDDQARDEFFEDMMQSVRVLFMTEERDLLPLVAGS